MREEWSAAEILLRGAFLLFMAAAAWQDFRRRSISRQTFTSAGMAGIVLRLWLCAGAAESAAAAEPGGALPLLSGGIGGSLMEELGRLGLAVIPGLLLLWLSRATRESVGRGDGLFFVVSGIYLGLGINLFLLIGGLFLCFPVSAALLMWGKLHGKWLGKEKLPFLPFVIPLGMGVIFL